MSIQMSFVSDVNVTNFDSFEELKLCIENALDRWSLKNWKIVTTDVDSYDVKIIGESNFLLSIKTLEDRSFTIAIYIKGKIRQGGSTFCIYEDIIECLEFQLNHPLIEIMNRADCWKIEEYSEKNV